MNQLRYWFAQVLRTLRSRFLIQLAAIGSITVGLFLIGLSILCSLNLNRLTHHWNQGIHIIAYLKNNADPSQIKKFQGLLSEQAVVAHVNLVSSEEAYQRLQQSLGKEQNFLTGVEKNFLPASLELTLHETQPERLRPLLGLLNASSFIEEVDYMGGWIERLTSLITFIRFAGIFVALIISLACLYIIASTIRLGVFTRQDEIRILKLVGATDSYVRAPFVIEGAIQGFFGALLATGLLYMLFTLAAPRIETLMSSAFSPITLGFFSPLHVGCGILCGITLGVLGSRLALGRYLAV